MFLFLFKYFCLIFSFILNIFQQISANRISLTIQSQSSSISSICLTTKHSIRRINMGHNYQTKDGQVCIDNVFEYCHSYFNISILVLNYKKRDICGYRLFYVCPYNGVPIMAYCLKPGCKFSGPSCQQLINLRTLGVSMSC